MKPLNVKISLAGMTSFLLVAASLLGSSSLCDAYGSSFIINRWHYYTTTVEDNGGTTTTMSDNTSLNATATATSSTTTSTIELTEEPFAVGHYREVSENMITETEAQFSFEGNTTITLPKGLR